MTIGAGEFDRRILVQVATLSRDRSGDELKTWTTDAPPSFKRWARKMDNRGFEIDGAQELVRQGDTVFALRADAQSRSIAPETHRFFYKDRIYEIVAIQEGKQTRGESLEFLTSTRPDGRGPRGPVDGDGQ